VRSELIHTHLTCNQACTYCDVRRPTLDRAHASGRAVIERVDAAIRSGADEIVISGGEPAMRSDLAMLVHHAASGGCSSVGLETNATLVTAEMARALSDAGLSWARVNVSVWGEASDAITRDPGGFERTLQGMRELTSASVPIEVSSVVIRATLSGLPELPDRLRAEDGLAVARMLVRVPVTGPRAEDFVSYEEAGLVLRRLAVSARSIRLPLQLAHGSGPPPCALEHPIAMAHLYVLDPDGDRRSFVRIEACSRCLVRDRCSGVPSAYVERFGPPLARAVTSDRLRRRLASSARQDELVVRELVQPNRYLSPETGEPIDEALVRVVYHCNQRCRFCFVPTHLPAASHAMVSEAIARAGREGKQVTLTGGEPTLHPRLADYVRLAKSASPLPVGLQTNAIRFADTGMLDELIEAGLGAVQVSLHASSAEVSDSITGAPGSFERTVRGIDALHASKVDLALNFVMTRSSINDLAAFVRLVASRWPRATVGFAFVAASSDMVPRDAALLPRYGEVLPKLSEAVDEGERLGLRVGGFESMCGLPLCVLPERLRARVADIPAGYDRGEFVKPPPCQGCSLSPKCYGVRRSYIALYGHDELRPV
jgi:MoaA/NifB/PqqE/SkfB family radical SAM enzyme